MVINLSEGDVVLCTVNRIEGTVVFVTIESLGNEAKDIEGTIIMTELSSGRIRNIRDYVVPNKKIVCKVLRVSENRIDLSLRRVSNKEKKEVMEQYQLERSYLSVLRSMLKEKADKIISEITKKESLFDFLERVKTNPKELENLLGKADSQKILDILNSQKKKKAIIKKEFELSTNEPNGLEIIKSILGKVNNSETKVKYLAAGKYTIETESSDLKAADNKIWEILGDFEKNAKKLKIDFSIK